MGELPLEISEDDLIAAFKEQARLEGEKRIQQQEPTKKTAMRVFRIVLASKTGVPEFEAVSLEDAERYHEKALQIYAEQKRKETMELLQRDVSLSKRNPDFKWGEED